MKKKKLKKKRIYSLIFIVILVLLAYALLHITIMPKIYLANKYDISISNVQIEKYYPRKLYSDFQLSKLMDFDASKSNTYFTTEKWDCIINNREFTTEHYMFRFVDDYQLEDLFDWGTNFLQEHIDKNIIGVDIGDGTIYKTQIYIKVHCL